MTDVASTEAATSTEAWPATSRPKLRTPSPATVAGLLPSLLVLVAAAVMVPLARETGDEANYLAYAERLTRGGYASRHSPWPVDYLWHGPGLPLLVAPLVALDAPLALVRLVGPLLLWAALVAFFTLTAEYTSSRTAVWSTCALLLYLPFYAVLGPLHVEPLATLLFTLVVLFTARAVRGVPHAHWWAGLAFALLALSRVEYGWVLVIVTAATLLWALARRRSALARRLAAASCLGLVCCVPWLAYTHSLTGRAMYWGNSGGLSLYWMAAPTPGNLGDWHPPFISPFDSFLASNAPAVRANQAALARVARLPPLEQDPRLVELALANIRRHPDVYLANLVNNSSRLLFNFPYSHSAQSDRPLIYTLPNALLLGGLAAAAVTQVRDRRRARPELRFVGALVLLGFAIHLPVAAFGRFTMPLVPAIAFLVVATLVPRNDSEAG